MSESYYTGCAFSTLQVRLGSFPIWLSLDVSADSPRRWNEVDVRLSDWIQSGFVLFALLTSAATQTTPANGSPATTQQGSTAPGSPPPSSPCPPPTTSAPVPASTPAPGSTNSPMQPGASQAPQTPPSGAAAPAGTQGAGTPSGANQGPLVSISVAATSPSAVTTAQSQRPSGPTNVEVWAYKLPTGNNASDIAAALKGNIPQIASVTALGNNQLMFVLDVSPLKASDKPQDPKLLEDQISAWVKRLAQEKSPLAVEVYAKTLPPGSGNAADVVSKLNNVIPGVTNIIPLGNATLLFLLDRTPDPRFPSTPRDIAGLKAEVDVIVGALAVSQPVFYMLPFPLGTGKNCDVANALGKQFPGVLNISPVGTTRLAFEIDGRLSQAQQNALQVEINNYVSAMAEPVTAPSPNTENYTQRLFYDHDPTTAAAIIHASYPEVNASAIVPDTVVLSETIPAVKADGEKRDPLQDARRLVTQIDQPRPQVSLDAWSIQVSTTSEKAMAQTGPLIDAVAKKYNDVMASSTQRGWQYLVIRLAAPYLDPVFSDYLTGQAIVPVGQNCCAITLPTGNYSDYRSDYAVGSLGYSLGYRTFFSSLPPNLVYMLVTLAATRNPQRETERIINTMETGDPQSRSVAGGGRCQDRDQSAYSNFSENHHDPSLQLECVRDLLSGQLFAPVTISSQLERPNTTALGRLRAAIADFLFQYKMLTEYRDDFEPFSEAQAAANLDAQLSPIVDAFTSDLEVFQRQIKNEIEQSELLKQRNSGIAYAASGIVSVKVVGGNQANVQTTTQNYFDATPPATLGDFASAITSLGKGSTSSSGAAVPPSLPSFLTSNMTMNEAMGALAAIQALTRTPVSARIGKGLILTATPYSLSGASGAEMDISVESNENGAELLTAATASNLSSVTAQSDDLASRVSDHKVSTRVRVDSLKLFDLSTMESVLARGKSPWRPIDPWLEIPVLGQIVRVPRKPAITYHRSFIFINAFLVPTAADLASGVRIHEDLVFTAGQVATIAHHFKDLGGANAYRISQFHQHMLDWFAAETIELDGSVQSPPAIPVLSNAVSIQ